MSLRTAVLYLEAETRSAFLLLSVWEVSRESRVLGPGRVLCASRNVGVSGGPQTGPGVGSAVGSRNLLQKRQASVLGQNTGPCLEAGLWPEKVPALGPHSGGSRTAASIFSPSKQEVPPSLQWEDEMKSFV